MLHFRLSANAFLAEVPRCGTFVRSEVFFIVEAIFFIIIFCNL